MRKAILILTATALLSACTSSNQYGRCVGAFDKKNEKLEYSLSVWNAFVGVFFFGLILPPIFVIANETFCPIGENK